uniref:Uncharacterized protein n=1 Tax=Anguilla anguilla TaxID=7936 RepID=A0A0E9UDC5_ANGAN
MWAAFVREMLGIICWLGAAVVYVLKSDVVNCIHYSQQRWLPISSSYVTKCDLIKYQW